MNLFGYVQHKRVVVNLWSGTAVAGVMTTKARDYCVIKDAQVVESGSDPMKVDGEIVIDRTNIDFIQVL